MDGSRPLDFREQSYTIQDPQNGQTDQDVGLGRLPVVVDKPSSDVAGTAAYGRVTGFQTPQSVYQHTESLLLHSSQISRGISVPISPPSVSLTSNAPSDKQDVLDDL
ncbi:hypothetical protein HGRIS_001204 [Hohenbuehelia grisea]|uniref:Uncharacterized protein n=1 Tax=Hohenbuehelia grisea TaxID=104357 RepID=A0ABR3JPV4_9AGAR